MDNDFRDSFQVGNANIVISPSLKEDIYVLLFSDLLDRLCGYGFDRFEHDEEKKILRLDLGKGISKKDERVIRISEGNELAIIWGTNTAFSNAVEICKSVSDVLQAYVKLIQVEAFNYQVFFNVPSSGNAYERIKQKIYADDTVGEFFKSMSKKHADSKVGDNDAKLTFHFGENKTGIIIIKGKTTYKEIITEEYDDDPISLIFGIQQKPKERLWSAFSKRFIEHIKDTHILCQDVFYKTIVKSFIEKSNKE